MGAISWSKPQEDVNLSSQNNVQCTQEEDDEQNTSLSLSSPQLELKNTVDEVDNNIEKINRQKDLDDFKIMLDQKREERRNIISRISEEMNNLRQDKEDLEKERTLRIGLEKQVKALKEVSVVSNEMLQLRETQVNELKKRLLNVESGAVENLNNLRTQYEKQIENIRKLRQLYEERADATARGHEKEIEKEKAKNALLELKLEEYAKDILSKHQLNDKVKELEMKLIAEEEEVNQLKEVRASLASECSSLTSQLTLINNLFSNMLTGDMNFDLLIQLLQDNHNLITDLIANGDINDTASLLMNIAEKAYKHAEDGSSKIDAGCSTTSSTKEEIASNLPKVWRMLIELLSSHEDSNHTVLGGSEECYKHVKTPSGSRTVISVSQTFLRLKDLILEKNCLVKEVKRLKTLNGHLENRLDLQEKRLGVVSSELRKTWGIVSKLKVQHRQLHTHEKILRYELQHKRQMLTDLKHELEYCKETWDKAREKNTQTEHDWEILRKEFALRKSRDTCNSAESGYEEESPDTSASELEYDLSDSQKSIELDLSSIGLEDAASDATVIELIDMFDLDEPKDTVLDDVPALENNIVSLSTTIIDDTSAPASTDDVFKEPNISESCNPVQSSRNSDEILDARANRLRRLEQQCQSLLNQMALTSLRSDTLSTRLEELHEQYGSEDRKSNVKGKTDEGTAVLTVDSEVSAELSDANNDERTSRLHKMEQTCMKIFDNVSTADSNIDLSIRLKNTVRECSNELTSQIQLSETLVSNESLSESSIADDIHTVPTSLCDRENEVSICEDSSQPVAIENLLQNTVLVIDTPTLLSDTFESSSCEQSANMSDLSNDA